MKQADTPRPLAATPIHDLRRGIHLPNDWLNPDHIRALSKMQPTLVVVLSSYIDPAAVEYLRSLRRSHPDVEIFVRYFPTTCPLNTGYPNTTTAWVVAKSPYAVAEDILKAYWIYHDVYQLELTHWIPGNEPDIEWTGHPFNRQKWTDIGLYYQQIYNALEEINGTQEPNRFEGYWWPNDTDPNRNWISKEEQRADIHLYTPAFTSNASVGVQAAMQDGTVIRRGVDDKVYTEEQWRSIPESSRPMGYNVQEIMDMINLYKRFTWHNYWWPGASAEQATYKLFPAWLRRRLYGPDAYYPSRITEAGWIIDALGPYPRWDAFVINNIKIADNQYRKVECYYEEDYRSFLDDCGASGVALWLLDSPDGNFMPMAALDSGDAPRAWFDGLIRLLDGETPSRPTSIGGSAQTGGGELVEGVTITTSAGQQATTDTSGSFFISGVPDGSYSLTATRPGYSPATASVGVGGETNATLSFQMSPLPVTISGVVVDGITSTSAVVRWTTNLASDSRVDYGTSTAYGTFFSVGNAVTSHAVSLSHLSPGTTYHYRVTSACPGHASGQSSDQTFTSALGTLQLGTPKAADITPTSATIRWTTNLASDSRVDYGTSTTYGKSASVGSAVTSHAVSLSGLSPRTLYHYMVSSARPQYRTAQSGDQTFTTLGTIKLGAPTTSTPTSTSATICWTTDVASDSRVDYGTSTAYGESARKSEATTWHPVSLSGLTPDTAYHFRVSSGRPGYKTAQSGDKIFTTLKPIHISGLSVGDVTSTSATVRWTTDVACESRVDYGIDDTEESVVNEVLTPVHAVTLGQLAPGTTYRYRAGGSRAGYESVATDEMTFTTALGTITMSAPAVSNITSTSATVRWTTNEACASRVDFGTTSAYGRCVSGGSGVTSHVVNLVGLSPATPYHYRAKCMCSGYQTAQSTDLVFSTSPGGTLDVTVYRRVSTIPGPEAAVDVAARLRSPADMVPLAGAVVSVAGRSATTSANGWCRITGIPGGAYTATCTYGECAHSAAVTIKGGAVTHQTWAFDASLP